MVDGFSSCWNDEPVQLSAPLDSTGWIDTPLGLMVALATEKGLCLLEFADRKCLDRQLRRVTIRVDRHLLGGENAHIRSVRDELTAYFRGHLSRFQTPLDPIGTEFQRRVWDALVQIPFGETCTYGGLAARVGVPRACRAVANANAANALAICVPCHRVTGARGALGGYAGWVWRKERLLAIEKGVEPSGCNEH